MLGPAEDEAGSALLELLDEALAERIRRALCGICDASQRRRETAAAEAQLERDPPSAEPPRPAAPPPGARVGPGALVPAGDARGMRDAHALQAASVTLKERVMLRDALHHLESQHRANKSPLVLWYRTAAKRMPARRASARAEPGGQGAGGATAAAPAGGCAEPAAPAAVATEAGGGA